MPSSRRFLQLLVLPILLASCVDGCVDGTNALDAPTTTRMYLHQPFFPDQAAPPAPPFFPTLPVSPSPPMPALQEQPTWCSPTPPPGRHGASERRRLTPVQEPVPAILLPLLTVTVLGLFIRFFFSHRRGNAGRGGGGGCVDGKKGKFLHPEMVSLFARDEFGGNGGGVPAAASAEFLYVGTSASRGDAKRRDTTSSGDEESRPSAVAVPTFLVNEAGG